jgi:TfoX/Sxy family transcriptional regulator of competence genes
MAYDEELADRIREVVQGQAGLTEQRMFGGLAFLINGNMAVAASSHGGLLLRCDPAETDRWVSQPHAARMEMRGREMDGWLRIEAPALKAAAGLKKWIKVGVDYAGALPAKRK